MRIMLTSFGIEQNVNFEREQHSLFYRMPPVSFRWINTTFMPDFDLLLLCDKLVMDDSSFQQLAEEPFPAYATVADTFSTLKAEGRIELVDFAAVLQSKKHFLNRMVDHDIRMLDQWVIPLRASLTLWRYFSDKSIALSSGYRELWHHESMHSLISEDYHAMHPVAPLMDNYAHSARPLSVIVEEALTSSANRKRKEHRKALREVLRCYLTYVNANLILSNALEVGFHDWLDFTPFYTTKFMSVGKDMDRNQEGRKQVERLFTVPFPELAIRDTRTLMKALNDKRIEDLRQLIGDAVAGKVKFDEQFAKSILREVLGVERTAKRWRAILGYLTMPIGLIPWVGSLAEKAVGETVGMAIERRVKQDHRWFYMLSEIAEATEKIAEPPGGADAQ